MDPRFEIPWAPPDIGPGVATILSAINANRQHERSREYLDMEREAVRNRAERESAAMARQKEQDEFTRDLKAMEAYPTLRQRAGRGDVPGANINPFGMQFDEQAEPEPSPAASAAQFTMNPKAGRQAEMPPIEEAPPDVLPRGVEGPIQTPEGQAYQDVHRRGEDDLEGLMKEATAGTPPITDIMTQAAMNAQPRQKRVFMTYKGQRTEVPEQDDVMSGIPEVDEMASHLFASGAAKTQQDAVKMAMGHYDKGQAELGRSSRQQATFNFRNLNREDQQTFVAIQNKLYKNEPTTAEEREKLARIRAAAMTASQGNKDEASVDRAMSLIGQKAKAFREITQYSKMVQSDKTIRELFNNISAGAVNLQNRDAQIQLAKYFRGSIPTGAEMTHLYTNLGGTEDAWARFKNHILKGKLTPNEISQLRASANAVRKEHIENKERMVKVGQRFFGPGSGLDNYPDQAQSQFDAHLIEMGIDPQEVPPLYSTVGGASMGSFARPSVRPREEQRGLMDNLMDEIK